MVKNKWLPCNESNFFNYLIMSTFTIRVNDCFCQHAYHIVSLCILSPDLILECTEIRAQADIFCWIFHSGSCLHHGHDCCCRSFLVIMMDFLFLFLLQASELIHVQNLSINYLKRIFKIEIWSHAYNALLMPQKWSFLGCEQICSSHSGVKSPGRPSYSAWFGFVFTLPFFSHGFGLKCHSFDPSLQV